MRRERLTCCDVARRANISVNNSAAHTCWEVRHTDISVCLSTTKNARRPVCIVTPILLRHNAASLDTPYEYYFSTDDSMITRHRHSLLNRTAPSGDNHNRSIKYVIISVLRDSQRPASRPGDRPVMDRIYGVNIADVSRIYICNNRRRSGRGATQVLARSMAS